MRVTQLTEFASRRASGLFASVCGLSTALHDNSLAQVRVVARRDDASELDRLSWRGVDLVHVDTTRILSLITAREMADECLRAPVDIFHVHNLWTCAERAMVNLRRRGIGTPYVFSPRGSMSPWALAHRRWKKQLSWPLWEKTLIANATCFHALNEAEVEMIRQVGAKGPICVIPNGVSVPATISRSLNRRERKLLFLGRLHPIKGLSELINAWGRLPARVRDEWKLVLAGWDDSLQADEYRAHAARVASDSIIFPGPVFGPQKDELFRDADAFILPSHSEGLPTSVLEAWSFGLPAVITDACNLTVGVSRGAAVRIAPEADSICNVLTHFLSQPDQIMQKMGQAGRQLVEEKFSWKSVAVEMAAVYHWLLHGGDRPRSVVF
ncbi:glycosyltransferase [Bradyrhizobium sp. BR 10289]|uniref:glycosyltransferase n=1 Tax=Bradyrhizobium sp. BR 10289 TaxID=2749993 RepID=UPI0032E00C5E